jgi:hypothetical protein
MSYVTYKSYAILLTATLLLTPYRSAFSAQPAMSPLTSFTTLTAFRKRSNLPFFSTGCGSAW